MHVLTGQTRPLEASQEPVDLGQTPGDMVVLSAADTDLSGLASARAKLGDHFPSLRLANWMQLSHPYSVDLYAEAVLGSARLIVIRSLGGPAYWPYGTESALSIARASSIPLAVLPGEATWDPALLAHGTVVESDARALWSYMSEGGPENFTGFLRYGAWMLGGGQKPARAAPLPTCGIYGDASHKAADASPTAAILFYRALVQSGQTEPIDCLCESLRERGLRPLPIFVSSLKSPADAEFVSATLAEQRADLVLNTTAFSISRPGMKSASTLLDGGTRPVFQVIISGSSMQAWADSDRGLSASDLTMNVVMPELDGRLITRAISFKDLDRPDPITQFRPVRYRPQPDRVDFVSDLAAAWTRLQRAPNPQKRVAIIVSNYPGKDGRIGNGVGLDAPASVITLLSRMKAAGFDVESAPRSASELMDVLTAGPTNRDPGRAAPAAPLLPDIDYAAHFQALPEGVRDAVTARWGDPDGDPFFTSGGFRLPLHRFGNLVIGIQPARGYNIDPKSTYHDPDLVPPHGYFAFYFWLRRAFEAHALIHMGKHGNLEWLPGKALALSAACFPEAVLGPMPLLYPFIVNDPGEGAQAKRRSQAAIVDHLMPPMARAESYGTAAQIEHLIDEYADARHSDPRRARRVCEQILDRARSSGLLSDIGLESIGDSETALARLDEHICDLKELQIRDGLHILGKSPGGRQRSQTLSALVRLPRGGGEGGDASLIRALAADLGLGEFDPLDCRMSDPWTGPRPDRLAEVSLQAWRTYGDTVERLELAALSLIEEQCSAPVPAELAGASAVLESLQTDIAISLDRSGDRELGALMAGLAGRFIPPGPSGAPTRGRPDCLPTGRNFYTVDVRSVPTPAAYDLGSRSAELLARRYFEEEGDWPKAIALTAWGTANMRTGGDDIAQALALIGAKPVWDAASGRVIKAQAISLSELGRPRVDVTLRISGFFRDAFPTQITLFHEAVRLISERDEPAAANPIAARIRKDAAELAKAGMEPDAAHRTASFRVFGSKPGAYGAGLQALIDEGIWSQRSDLAEAFLEWSSYAYGGGAEGEGAAGALRTRLDGVDAVVHNQDNREHDILDSDDYYQFQGGLAVAVEHVKGTAPRIYHNDHSRPERPVVRALEEEIARVVRGRAANPKWIRGVMRHQYKGGFEIAATVDYLFAFAATTRAVKAHHFEQLYDAYLMDDKVRDFLNDNNPAALREIASRFAEAIERNLWTPRRNSVHDRLAALAGSVPGQGLPQDTEEKRR